jgi:hypothetical protein
MRNIRGINIAATSFIHHYFLLSGLTPSKQNAAAAAGILISPVEIRLIFKILI